MNQNLRIPSFQTNITTALVLRILSIFFLFQVTRILFFAFNAGLFPEVNTGRLLTMMAGGTLFDISAILYTNAAYIALYLIPHPYRFKSGYQTFCKYLFLITNSVALSLNFADIIYYRFSLRRTTLQVVDEFKGHDTIGLVLLRFLWDYWYMTILFALAVYLLVRLYNSIELKKPEIKRPVFYYLGQVLILLVGSYLIFGGLRGGFMHSTRPITLNNAGEYVVAPKEMNIVLNTPFALYRTFNKPTLKQVNYFPANVADALYPTYYKGHKDSSSNKLNVVVIIIESFGKEYIGAFNKHIDNGKYKGYTPFMDSLVGQSKTFWYSMANGRKSIDAMPSILSSIPSIKTPYVLSHYSGNKINSMAGLLSKNGYHTAFFHGAPNGSMGFQAFANLSGFKEYYGKNEYANDADFDGIWGIWDDRFLQFYAKKMDSFKQPFFTTVFTLSSHHPFLIPKDYEGKLSSGPLELHRCINYADKSLQKFFQTASKMPWYKNTLFVITADHCSQPYYEEYKTEAGFFKIPLIFFQPGNDSLRGIEPKIAQQIDIMPTILNYLNYDKDFVAFGQDLFNKKTEPLAINYINNVYQLFLDDYMLQYNDEAEKSVALYDFKNDIFLRKNLLTQKPAIRKKMEDKIKAFIQSYNSRMVQDKMTAE